MNKARKILALSLLPSCLVVMAGCNGKIDPQNMDKDNIVFRKANTVISNYEGLGVEWGTYEDPDKLSSDSWERSLRIMDRLNPQVVRCMLNYDWFITNYDDKKDQDKTNDTWEYNFSNKLMNNTVNVLRYCTDHNIDTAFGCCYVPGHVATDEYNM